MKVALRIFLTVDIDEGGWEVISKGVVDRNNGCRDVTNNLTEQQAAALNIVFERLTDFNKGTEHERPSVRDSVDTTTDNINALPAIREESDGKKD